MAVHFVGFRDDRFHNAVKVFGKPDFFHRNWDWRAFFEVADGDVVVFAKGSEHDTPKEFTFNDSEVF